MHALPLASPGGVIYYYILYIGDTIDACQGWFRQALPKLNNEIVNRQYQWLIANS